MSLLLKNSVQGLFAIVLCFAPVAFAQNAASTKAAPSSVEEMKAEHQNFEKEHEQLKKEDAEMKEILKKVQQHISKHEKEMKQHEMEIKKHGKNLASAKQSSPELEAEHASLKATHEKEMKEHETLFTGLKQLESSLK